jgi:hypothetical protein
MSREARMSNPERFFGREIKVVTGGQVKVPVSFHFDDREYTVAEVLETWPDHDFGRSSGGRKRWWQRHHRTYYRVLTTSGEAYEMYYDRGVNLEHPEFKKWYLTRRL